MKITQNESKILDVLRYFVFHNFLKFVVEIAILNLIIGINYGRVSLSVNLELRAICFFLRVTNVQVFRVSSFVLIRKFRSLIDCTLVKPIDIWLLIMTRLSLILVIQILVFEASVLLWSTIALVTLELIVVLRRTFRSVVVGTKARRLEFCIIIVERVHWRV